MYSRGSRTVTGTRLTETPLYIVQHQLSRWKIALNLFNSLWEQEYTRRRLTITWKEQGRSPQVGDVVLFKNEPINCHPISAARVEALLCRNNGDVYGATISYCLEVGGRNIIMDQHLHQLYPFDFRCGETAPSGNNPRTSRRLRSRRSDSGATNPTFPTSSGQVLHGSNKLRTLEY